MRLAFAQAGSDFGVPCGCDFRVQRFIVEWVWHGSDFPPLGRLIPFFGGEELAICDRLCDLAKILPFDEE